MCDGLAMWQFEIPVVEYIRRRPVGCSADATETKPNQKGPLVSGGNSLLLAQVRPRPKKGLKVW